MLRVHLVATMIFLAGWLGSSPNVIADELRVVREIDFPERLERPFALGWDGELLAVSALVPAGEGTLGTGFLRVDPADGSVASEFGLQGLPIRGGMTFDGTDFWTSSAGGYIDWVGVRYYNHIIEKWSGANGAQLESLSFHYSHMEPTGLEWDGTDLWLLDERRLIANDRSAIISRLDPNDLTVVESFPVPGTDLYGLAWDGSAFWTIDVGENAIYRFDSKGNVLAEFSAPDDDPRGITYDGKHLWVAGNAERKLYQLAVPEPSTCALLSIAAASVLISFGWRQRRKGSMALFTPCLCELEISTC